jgi:serine/threonine protein kinase
VTLEAFVDHDPSPWPFDDFAEAMRTSGYQVLDRLGGSETAETFLAYQAALDRQVELTSLLPQLAADPALKKRFVEESRVAAAIDHDHIIPIYDVGEVRGTVYVATRYLPAGDVGSLLRWERSAGRQLPVQRVAEIVRQMASALDAAHASNLLHRDVRPANMLLEAHMDAEMADQVYLAGFGLSPRSHPDAGPSGGAFDGTVGYVAPEQIAGRPVAGSDQYSLGCSAYEMLTGRVPFDDVAGHLKVTYPLATSLRRDLNRDADAVFERVLAWSPAARYADCGQFAAHLAAALGAGPAPAPEVQREPARRPDPPPAFEADPPRQRAHPTPAPEPAFAWQAPEVEVEQPSRAVPASQNLELAQTVPVIRRRKERRNAPHLAGSLGRARLRARRSARVRWARVAGGLTAIVAIVAFVVVVLSTMTGPESRGKRSAAELTPGSVRTAPTAQTSTSPGKRGIVLPPSARRHARHRVKRPTSAASRARTRPSAGQPTATPAPRPTPRPTPAPTVKPSSSPTPKPRASKKPSTGYGHLRVLSSGYYLDVFEANITAYAQLDVWYDNGDANQLFTYPNQNGEVGEIVGKNSGMCVTTDGKAGDTLYQYPCRKHRGEMWKAEIWTSSGKKLVTFLNPHSGLVMDILYNSYSVGASVDAWYPNHQQNQAFIMLR